MFIETLGAGYATDNLYGSYFMYENKLHRVERITDSTVHSFNLTDGGNAMLPARVITGWRTFKYPRLGYRRITDEVVAWVQRAARSYSRGLNAENLICNISDASYRSCDLNEDYFYEEHQYAIAKAAMCPEWDSKDVWFSLLNGDKTSYVPTNTVLIEKDYNTDNFAVYSSTLKLGSITKAGVIIAPQKNVPIITNIVRKYAA